eukprot:CAMPEP_0181312876 /NCGR_PEP_ID=MMETSP1101-20121128/13941_1 /TAXON_ID=46948 /ORGANISM="Rhodomonas abbreviata, Strain Caron Lab Isolate" /LENGTH=89 /DNA_ID=CAMNT_0023419777 /DNA_START=249 /DNA_END=517 /DNA_ORIENTATION=-
MADVGDEAHGTKAGRDPRMFTAMPCKSLVADGSALPVAGGGSWEVRSDDGLTTSLEVSRELQVLPPLRVSKLPETPFWEYPPELFEVQT